MKQIVLVITRSISSLVFLLTLGAAVHISATQAAAATFTVTKTADTNDGTCDADCSLREAVAAANTNLGHDTIEFNIPTSDDGYVAANGNTHAYWSLPLNSGLVVTDANGVFINGYSQSGASRNTASFGQTNNALLTIQVVQSTVAYFIAANGGSVHLAGLNVQSLPNVSGGNSIFLSGSSGSHNNWFEGNFFGTDITGTESVGGWGSITIYTGSNYNIVGTNGDGVGDKGERNVILINNTGNNGSIYVQGDNNVIAGNYIGVNKTGRVCGTGSLKRQHIFLDSGTNNRIGTNFDSVSDDEEANIIACINTDIRAQIRVQGTGSVIQGNFIGTNPHLDNLNNGLAVPGIRNNSAVSNYAIKKNVIAYNGSAGIDIHSLASSGNTIRGNRIFGNGIVNGKPDIDLGSDGQTLNDFGDTDTGPNDLMNYPVITHANYVGGGRYAVGGTLDGNPAEAPYTIEVCKSSNHSSGHGGCIQSLATTTTTTGDWEVRVTVDGDSDTNLSSFSALATNANGSTSEFSANFQGVVATSDAEASDVPRIEFTPQSGAVVTKQNVVAIAHANTFQWDSILSVHKTPQASAFNLPRTPWWQASDVHEIWWKAYANDARILASEVKQPFIVALKYDPAKLDPNLPEQNLRLAYSADEGKTWRLVTHSVLDIHNKTVATVTKEGGHYMLVSGYPRRLF